VTVTTERVDLGKHAVFFNRGAVGSQEYARRFQNLTPPEVGQAAYDWLSRGLVEGLESFIAQAAVTDDVIRFALMESKGSGSTFAAQSAVIDRISKRPNVTVSVGHHIEINMFDRWLAELGKIVDDAHVMYVHTKHARRPARRAGGRRRLGQLLGRLDDRQRREHARHPRQLGGGRGPFSHYAFRESLTFKARPRPPRRCCRKYLIDSLRWIQGKRPGQGYFDAGPERTLRRALLLGAVIDQATSASIAWARRSMSLSSL
jgi:hypothetical protein